MTRTIAIVQARMGSVRFPEKMMATLNGHPVIEWVLARTRRAQLVDEVVLATTRRSEDDVLAEVAERLGIAVHRGSERDVLGRYAEASRLTKAEVVVRICGDRPLVDPAVVDLAVATYEKSGPDLAFNHISDGTERWPRGFGAEVLSAELLHWLADNAHAPEDREHVTYYLWQRRDRYRLAPALCPEALDPGVPDLKLDLDTPEDLTRLARLARDCGLEVTAADIVNRWRGVYGIRAEAGEDR